MVHFSESISLLTPLNSTESKLIIETVMSSQCHSSGRCISLSLLHDCKQTLFKFMLTPLLFFTVHPPVCLPHIRLLAPSQLVCLSLLLLTLTTCFNEILPCNTLDCTHTQIYTVTGKHANSDVDACGLP